MAKVEYDQDKDLERMVDEMIDDPTFSEFNELRDLGIVVLPCVRIRMDDDGETQPCKGDPVSIKKVGEVERFYMPKKPHFLMIVDYHAWNNVGDNVRQPMLHHGLMKINVEKSEKGTKIGTRKPDIVEFSRTIERFGAFNDSLLNCREAFRNSTHRILPNVADEPEELNETEEVVNNAGDNRE